MIKDCLSKLFGFRYQVIALLSQASHLEHPFRLPQVPGDSGEKSIYLGEAGVEKFDELSRELGYTFTELESAEGAAKRRCLRKAHLLLLLADEIIADSESPGPPLNGTTVIEAPAGVRSLPLAFVEDAVHSAERGPCRGLQTVLVLRQRSIPAKNPEAATRSHARRAQS